jgi:hypothetical protein
MAAEKAEPKAVSPVRISMVASNAVDKELPYGVFTGKGFHAIPEAKYVKLHLYMDQPIKNVGRVEITTCNKAWTSGMADKAVAYFNFDEVIGDSDSDSEIQSLQTKLSNDKTLVFRAYDFSPKIPDLDSLTINFGDINNVCIQSVSFFTEDGAKIPIETSVPVEGQIKASSVQVPAEAYSPENLFDSKFEYSWATNKVANGANLEIHFDLDTRVEKLKIWNGYQRSVVHCQQNSRVKALTITGDNNYSAEVKVEDKLGGQEISLPKPFTGKNLKLTVKESIKGKSYEDLAISEMRFFDGKSWLLINPIKNIQSINQKIRAEFKKANLDSILNNEITSSGLSEGSSWIFRFRSDGSMFIEGYGYSTENKYSALGNFEIKSASAKGIQVRVFGYLYKSKFSMDCNGCGLACNSPAKQDGSSEKIFQQVLTLKPAKKDGLDRVLVVNETKAGKLKFKELYTRVLEE